IYLTASGGFGHRPVAELFRLQARRRRRVVFDGADATGRHVDAAAFVYERPAERRVMSPCEIDLLAAFVRHALVDAQHRLVAAQADGLDQLKWRPHGANVEAHFDPFSTIFRVDVAPRAP